MGNGVQVIRALSAPPPSAADLDSYLLGIAKTYKVQWEPELRTDDVYVFFFISLLATCYFYTCRSMRQRSPADADTPAFFVCSLRILSELLDRSNAAPVVDIPRLRRVCAHGARRSPISRLSPH